MDAVMEVASCKRQRVSDNNEVLASAGMGIDAASQLLGTPREVLERVLRLLDSVSLSRVSQTCKAFRVLDNGTRLVDKIAREGVLEAAGDQAGRWRRRNWLSRLYIEDCNVGFANFQWSCSTPSPTEQGASPQYRFLAPTNPGSYLNIKLDGMGPKLLVSDLSTADQPVLRWRLAVRGNTAVEFGVVPLNMVEDDKSLHKCQQEEKKFEKLLGPLVDSERPTGFCSSITVGSMLPFKTAIMKGSVVELLARRGRLEILVQNPADGQELYWHNTRTVPKPYKGPKEVRFEQDFSPDHDVKLALTSWAHGAFDVVHPAPGSRLLGAELRKAWHLSSGGKPGNISRTSSSLRGVKRKPSSSVEQQQQHQQANDAVPLQQQQQCQNAAASSSLLQHQQQPEADGQQTAQRVPRAQRNQTAAAEAAQVSLAASQQQVPAAAVTSGPMPSPAPVELGGAIVSATTSVYNHEQRSPASDESTASGEGQL